MDAITPEQVREAFTTARACVGAENCKLLGQAMCELAKFDNQHTITTGEGRFTFIDLPDGPCPNRDQLFCQDPASD